MCGIVGCIGNKDANSLVLEGLRRLEYRGYDSCGIAYKLDNNIKIEKSIDRIKNLTENVAVSSNLALGHTRWATHGGVNLENAHPHQSSDDKMVLVHNGVIENYEQLREKYCKGVEFKSQTDTEVLLYVLKNLYDESGNIKEAISEFMKVVHGSYALIMHHVDFPNKLFVIKYKSPILIGKGDGFVTISSDPSAVIDQVNNFYQVEDYKFLEIEANNVMLYNKDMKQEVIKFETIDMEYEEISTQEYDSFMEKEITEQPKALRNIVENYKALGFDNNLKNELKNASRVYIIACGTSYNSGLICKSIIEEKLNIPVEVAIASEYGYGDNIIVKEAFFIFLSQSGETADSMLVFNKIKGNYPILAITNVRGSQMDRNADYSLQLFAGVEVAVASTKAYTSQIAVLAALVYDICGDSSIYDDLLIVADAQEKIINNCHEIKNFSEKLVGKKELFYLGRLNDYYLAQECALKVKEVTYLNVNAIPSGELKHGTISLIDEDKLVFALITNKKVAANTRSNIEEVRARNGKVVIFSTTDTQMDGDDYIIDYNGNKVLTPLVSVIVHQYIALFLSNLLNLDVDKPRNLAKAVTVE